MKAKLVCPEPRLLMQAPETTWAMARKSESMLLAYWEVSEVVMVVVLPVKVLEAPMGLAMFTPV